MSDTITVDQNTPVNNGDTPVMDIPKPEDQQLNTDKTNDQQVNEELINSLVEKKLEDIKSFYTEKLDVLKKQNAGLDRKVSELTKQNKKYENEKLTEEEKFELEKKELQENWQTIYREKALAKNGLIPDEDETIDFSHYLYGDTEDEVMEKAAKLKEYIDTKIKKGVEKGINERLLNGSYMPTGSKKGDGDSVNIQDMTKEELTEYAISVSKMPDGKEKSALLDKLTQEQQRRFQR